MSRWRLFLIAFWIAFWSCLLCIVGIALAYYVLQWKTFYTWIVLGDYGGDGSQLLRELCGPAIVALLSLVGLFTVMAGGIREARAAGHDRDEPS